MSAPSMRQEFQVGVSKSEVRVEFKHLKKFFVKVAQKNGIIQQVLKPPGRDGTLVKEGGKYIVKNTPKINPEFA